MVDFYGFRIGKYTGPMDFFRGDVLQREEFLSADKSESRRSQKNPPHWEPP